VVGKFVEFYGDGLNYLPLADRATIANMAPEYGATCGIFPIDDESLNYLRLSGRSEGPDPPGRGLRPRQGLWRTDVEAEYSATLHLDMADVLPSLAGPKRPQDRVLLTRHEEELPDQPGRPDRQPQGRRRRVKRMDAEGGDQPQAEHLARSRTKPRPRARSGDLSDGSVVIAAITSCTNTPTRR
jgi:aconitate hydratase